MVAFIGLVAFGSIFVCILGRLWAKFKKKPKDACDAWNGGILLSVIVFAVAIYFSPKSDVADHSSTAKQVQSTETATAIPAKTPEEIKKDQQAAFTQWYSGVEKDLNSFDSTWAEWKKTFDGMSNGTLSKYDAYSRLKRVEKNLGLFSSKFQDTKPPEGLSKSHRDAISTSMSSLSDTASLRQMAAQQALDMLDNNDFKPSKVEELKQTLQSSDATTLKAAIGISTVKSELGLLDKQ